MTSGDEEGRRVELMQLRRLEIASFAEATTLLLLVCVAVPLKHLAGYVGAVHIMGPVHGMVFLAYIWMAVQTIAGGGWSRAETTRLFIGAFVPLGGFFNLSLLARKMASLR
jgi:integral membrane protein